MSGDFSVGEFMRVTDDERTICHLCCGFCEEAKEVVTGDIAVLPFGVRVFELGSSPASWSEREGIVKDVRHCHDAFWC